MSAFRASIPNNVRKTIQNIKEIAGNHSDEEIYAMLKECSMDPNETAQKLLFQDTFHEVKRKRDRRKENLNAKESVEPRWRQGMQGQGGRGGARGGYSSRYISYDASGGRDANVARENVVNQGMDRGSTLISSVSENTENKARSPAIGVANGPTNADDAPSQGKGSQLPGGREISVQAKSSVSNVNKAGSAQPPLANVKNSHTSTIRGEHGQPPACPPSSGQLSSSLTQRSVSGVCSSTFDPVLVTACDSRGAGAVGAMKSEAGSQRVPVEPGENKPVQQELATSGPFGKLLHHEVADSQQLLCLNEKVNSELGYHSVPEKVPIKAQGAERTIPSEPSQTRPSSSHAGSSGGRPSSNGSNRSQVVGHQKASGHIKEWKPKPTNPNLIQPLSTVSTSDVVPIVGTSTQSSTVMSSAAAEETASKLQKRLEELHFSDGPNVIIPNHLQVPEAERTGLSFGSFDASFGVSTSSANGLHSDKIATPSSELSQEIEETADEPSSSNENASPADHEGDCSDHPQSPTDMPENLSPGEGDIRSGVFPGPEYDQSMSETVLQPVGPQYSVVHSTPNYSAFGLMTPMLGSQFAPFESSETQSRDASQIPSFVSGNSMVLSTAAPSPLVTQAAGLMQSSIAVTQQPVPVFRQAAGVHISHYPTNYMPYNHYFSPPQIYVPPTIHHFLSSSGFPQQPPTGGMFQSPSVAPASAVKFSLSQYKPGTNASNLGHIGLATGYGPYTSTPAAFSPSPAVTTGNSSGNEDLAASQYKENNAYITGQQSEGSTVWIPAPGRDISALQASSFYNLPPPAQHVTFPTQAGHGAFAGLYHPAQTVAAAAVHPLLQQSQTMAGPVEIVGRPTGVYQQPQRPQINWGNNF